MMIAESSMLEELRTLQEQVALLQRVAIRRHRVQLMAVQPQPWLGQPVTFVVQVTDEAAEQPRVDLPVLLTTTWGRLRVADGYTLQEGESLVIRTDLSGAVTVTLLPPLAVQLGGPPQRALEAMLAQLDAAAPTPNALAPQFAALVAEYQQAVNDELRQAIDFYFRLFYQERFDLLTAYDLLQSWQVTNATITALALEKATPAVMPATGSLPLTATVQGAAVLPLAFKDWLGPWLQSYLDLAREQDNLPRQFELLKKLTSDPEQLLAATTALVQTTVSAMTGHTGTQIEQQVVTSLVTTLLDQHISDLPVATRVKLITGLPTATNAIRAVGGRGIAGRGANLGQVTADLKQELLQSVEGKVGALDQAQAGLGVRLAGLEGSVGGLQSTFQQKVDRSELLTVQGQLTDLGKGAQTINARLESFAHNFAQLDDAVGGFRGDLERIRTEIKEVGNLEVVTKLQSQLQELTTSFQSFDRTFTRFQEKTAAQLANTLARSAFEQFQNETGEAFVKLSERTEAFQAQFGKLQNDFGRFHDTLDKVQIDLRDVQEELKRRPGFQVIADLQALLNTMSTTVTTLTTDVSNVRDQVNLRLTDTVMRTELTQLRTDLGRVLATKIDQRQLEQSLDDFDARVKTLQTDFTLFRSNATRLRGDLDTLGTNLTKLRIDVDKLRPRP